MSSTTNALNLFYSDSSLILRDDWINIIHSIVTYADTIWINADCSFANNSNKQEATQYYSVFRDLIDENVIRTWRLESSPLPKSNSTPISQIITNDEQKILYQKVTQAVIKEAKAVKIRDAFNTQSKFVDARHELFSLGLTALLNADGVAFNKLRPNTLSLEPFTSTDTLQRYSYRLFSEFSVGDLSKLSLSDILKLRSLSKYLHEQINHNIKTRLLPLQSPDEKIAEDCQHLFHEYEGVIKELLLQKHGKNILKEISKDLMVNIVGIFLPIASLAPIIEKTINWIDGRSKRGFFLYMTEVKRRTH